MNTRDVTFLLLLGISTLATAKEPSRTPSTDTGRAPSLLIHEVVRQTRTGTEIVPVETPLQRGQSVAISLQASGFVQVVEERTNGQMAFLAGGKSSPATRRSGARRVPGVGWLRIGADAKVPAEHLACVRDRSVDGIFSNFGALNCIRHLEPVLRDMYHVLPDNGIAILCLMNRFSITETVAYLRRGRVREAFRRWRWSGVSVPVGSRHVLTWYHSLRSIKRMIRGRFTIVRVVGLNVLTPPPSFTHFHERAPRLMALARRMERRLDTLPFFSMLGDHFVVVLERFE